VFPFFIFGFIFTAGPRWQGAGELSQRDYLPAFALLACGWLLVWAALLLPQLLVAGLALAVGGWTAVALTLTRIALHRATDREHIVCVAIAVAWRGRLGAFWCSPRAAGCRGFVSGLRWRFVVTCCRFSLP
jgi:uncharacterized protein involved in response to NO